MSRHAIAGPIVYRPNQRHEDGWIRTWGVMIRNVIEYRELIVQLFKRDFLAGYKKSFLGYTWIFIAPLASIISWVFLQMTGILVPGEVGVPYPVYVLLGTSMWGLFHGFYNSAAGTLSAGAGLVMQVHYPHEVLLFKQTAEHLSGFTIGFCMNLAVLIAFGVYPSWKTVFLPVVALPLFFLGAAIGLIISMVSVVAVDINRVVNMVMGLLVWLTPVIYSDKVSNPVLQVLIRWNPLTYLVCSARDIVLYGRLYDVYGYVFCSLLSLVMFMIAWRLFYVSEDRIIERMI